MAKGIVDGFKIIQIDHDNQPALADPALAAFKFAREPFIEAAAVFQAGQVVGRGQIFKQGNPVLLRGQTGLRLGQLFMGVFQMGEDDADFAAPAFSFQRFYCLKRPSADKDCHPPEQESFLFTEQLVAPIDQRA